MDNTVMDIHVVKELLPGVKRKKLIASHVFKNKLYKRIIWDFTSISFTNIFKCHLKPFIDFLYIICIVNFVV